MQGGWNGRLFTYREAETQEYEFQIHILIELMVIVRCFVCFKRSETGRYASFF